MHENKRKYILKWESGGIVFVFLLGALLHFVFEWSGESLLTGAFASVNESVWEHFKQGFWPMCIWGLIEYRFIGRYTGNFTTAKAVAVYLIPLITALVFYAYTAIVGEEILIVDIFIFAIAISIGQIVSYKIILHESLRAYAKYVSMALIFLLAVILVVTTYYPPHLPIFMDEAGFYGIP